MLPFPKSARFVNQDVGSALLTELGRRIPKQVLPDGAIIEQESEDIITTAGIDQVTLNAINNRIIKNTSSHLGEYGSESQVRRKEQFWSIGPLCNNSFRS